jgi:hypothetical protein
MLTILREGRRLALAEPRVDMPGAKIIPGESRQLIALSLPTRLPALSATATAQGVRLSWDHRSDLSGLTFELHRGRQPVHARRSEPFGVPDGLRLRDPSSAPGDQFYALTCIARSTQPSRPATVRLPKESQSSDLPSPSQLNRTAGIRVPDGSQP